MLFYRTIDKESGYASLIGLLIAAVIILILVSLYFTGGPDESEEDLPVSEDSPENIKVLKAPLQQIKRTELEVRLLELKQAIQAYEALEGEKPVSFESLKEKSDFTFRNLPDGYAYYYDPLSEKASIRKGDTVVCE